VESELNYETWYPDWSKQLALQYTKAELIDEFEKVGGALRASTASHLRAIEKSTSMQGNSQHRAQARNVVASQGEYKINLGCALDIYKNFPEHTKEGKRG
jgi:hypothetical protein